MRMVVMPASSTRAQRKFLSSSIGRTMRLTARSSRSIRSLTYFDYRISILALESAIESAHESARMLSMAAVLALLSSRVIFSGKPCRSIVWPTLSTARHRYFD